MGAWRRRRCGDGVGVLSGENVKQLWVGVLRPGHPGLAAQIFFWLNLAKISVLQSLAINTGRDRVRQALCLASDHPALRAAISDPFRQPL